MNSARTFKLLMLVLLLGCITGGGVFQRVLNHQRETLGLTAGQALENAPPVLALTTQVLGGFRGLIANALWMRATDMQDEGKYFEMVQLSDWITKLEPHFVQVWLVQAWNMAYNISVKFSDHADRWRWVQRGIELLRDDGLRFNPDEPLIYRELAWFFQHKMGQNLDDGHVYYKGAWARDMMNVFGGPAPNFEKLLHPQTPEERQRAETLRNTYKMDAARMRELDQRYGPLDWRLPEAHAIYWASVGLDKSKPGDVLPLRRVVYQSMNLAFQRGRLVLSSNMPPRLLPNLDIIEKVNLAFEEQMKLEGEKPDVVARAQRGFLKEAPYQLFIHNRRADGERWMKVLRQKFPDAVPAQVTLSEYAVNRAMEQAQDQTQVKVASLVQAFVAQSYFALLEDRPDEAAQYMQNARDFWGAYNARVKGNQRLAIPAVDELKKVIVEDLLDPERGLQPEGRARLRTLLQLPAEATPAANTGK